MSSHKAILFLGCFVPIYLLLIVPWPGWNELYGSYFRTLGAAAFVRDGEKRAVVFQEHDLKHGFSDLHTQMMVGNRDQVDASGKGRAEGCALDTRSIGWVPTALTIALIVATPVPWQRRAWALLWGLLLVHLFILFTLHVRIWELSVPLGLLTLGPFWTRVLNEMDYALLTQMGVSFTVPVLIWILVTFRREDFKL